MTKTEQSILDRVRACNDQGALAGVSIKEFRFARRLAEAGKLVYVTWRPDLGAGYAVTGHSLTEGYPS